MPLGGGGAGGPGSEGGRGYPFKGCTSGGVCVPCIYSHCR